MHYYGLYSLDVSDTHIIDVSDFRADGDAAAILKVGNPVAGVSRELWNLGRKVMGFRTVNALPGRAYVQLEPNGVGNGENWQNDRGATIRLDTSLGFRALEKRVAPRTTISLPVFIVLGGKRHNALLRNLSTGGAMIVTSAPLILQMKVEFHCGAICAPGILVWQRRSGSGIKFHNPICERQLKAQVSNAVAI